MKYIGIMGGSFDPVHNGHLLLGEQAYTEYKLDEIWYMPSHIPPHKKDHQITDSADRIAMLHLALKDRPYCIVSEFEMEREGSTYTAQTLELLAQKYPEYHFHFIIGADSLFQLESWYHPERVIKLASFLVARREYEHSERTFDQQVEYLKKTYGARIHILHSNEVTVSSADIRRRVEEGKSISDLVPDSVDAYIKENRLYSLKP